MNRRGQTESIPTMFFRLLAMFGFTAAVIFVSLLFYDPVIDVRQVEASLMARTIYDCVAPNSYVRLERFDENNLDSLLDFCGITSDLDRYYVNVSIYADESSGNPLIVLTQGRREELWVRDYYRTSVDGNRYAPGYSFLEWPVYISGEEDSKSKIILEVLVKNEE